jgi:multiple sugar transport system ATP-binding protein
VVDNALMLVGSSENLPIPTSVQGPLADGRDVLLGLRPEWLSLASGVPDLGPILDLQVEVIEPTGPDVFVALRSGAHEIMARLPTGTPVLPGQKTAFALDLSKAVLFDAEIGVAL